MTTKVRGNKIQRKQRHMTTKDEDSKGRDNKIQRQQRYTTTKHKDNQKGKWAKR